MWSKLTLHCVVICLGVLLVIHGRPKYQDWGNPCEGVTQDNTLVVLPKTGCRGFVGCWNQVPSDPMFCAPETMFDKRNQTCEDRDRVSCPDFQGGSFCVPLRALEKDCRNYTECPNGEPVIKQCGENLFFSNTWMTCVSAGYLNLTEIQACKYNEFRSPQ